VKLWRKTESKSIVRAVGGENAQCTDWVVVCLPAGTQSSLQKANKLRNSLW